MLLNLNTHMHMNCCGKYHLPKL